jgi:hypothetical protein
MFKALDATIAAQAVQAKAKEAKRIAVRDRKVAEKAEAKAKAETIDDGLSETDEEVEVEDDGLRDMTDAIADGLLVRRLFSDL